MIVLSCVVFLRGSRAFDTLRSPTCSRYLESVSLSHKALAYIAVGTSQGRLLDNGPDQLIVKSAEGVPVTAQV